MGELLVQNKDIVIPGEKLATGMDFLPSNGSFRSNEDVLAQQLGIVNITGRSIRIVPLTGKYIPKEGDNVIGAIADMSFNNWYVDVGSAYQAMLFVSSVPEYIEKNADLSQYYNFKDIIYAVISKVTRSKVIELSMKGLGYRKLFGGKMITVMPSRVPRIIGKQGSMITMIKELTGCKIIVGQNGRIWIYGDIEGEKAATEAIMMVEQKSYKEGLTDEIKNFLESRRKIE